MLIPIAGIVDDTIRLIDSFVSSFPLCPFSPSCLVRVISPVGGMTTVETLHTVVSRLCSPIMDPADSTLNRASGLAGDVSA